MLLRRLRAAGVLGLMWAILCAPFGVAMQLTLALSVIGMPSGRDLWYIVWIGAASGAGWGLASGFAFAAALAVLERRRSMEQLARRRVVAWAALSGALFPIAVIAVVIPSVGVLLADMVPVLVAVSVSAVYGAVVGDGLLRAALSAKRIEGA
jgi:hypothetical protein